MWFYDIRADGRSLDAKRTPVTDNDLPDVLARWKTLGDSDSPEAIRTRTDQSFLVPRDEVAANEYVLSLSRYQEVHDDSAPTRPPREILAAMKRLNAEIDAGIASLEKLLE